MPAKTKTAMKKGIEGGTSSADVLVANESNGEKTWTVPHAADTTYLSHGYYRYIGKFPPQIAAKLLDDYYPGKGLVLDPMVGGGTVAVECLARGIAVEGWDINPVSLLISRCATRRVDGAELERHGKAIVEGLAELNDGNSLFSSSTKVKLRALKLESCEEYFSPAARNELGYALESIGNLRASRTEIADLLLLIVLASLRRISFANVKKMNLELDLEKKTVATLHREFARRLQAIVADNNSLPSTFSGTLANIVEQNAVAGDWLAEGLGMVVLHPPYLTNTAFSEATQLQLAVLGVGHKSIWKKELRCRGSFLHETNGLQKYLTEWGHTIARAAKALKKNGTLAVVVGDGQINYVRIPVGAITKEFAKDSGLRLVDEAFHVLNNHTGQTQNKKMRGQHVLVFSR